MDRIRDMANNPGYQKVAMVLAAVFIVSWLYNKLVNYMKSKSNFLVLSGNQKGNKPLVVEKDKIPVLKEGLQATYSLWLYVNSVSDKPTHILHLGNKDLSVVGPSIYLKPNKNDLAIKVSLQNYDQRFTNGKVGGAPANKACVFPYRVDWNKIGITKPRGVNSNMSINNCSQTADNVSPLGYCPIRLNSHGVVDNIKDFGSCGTDSMNPDINPGILDTNLCDIENIPMKRWFHLAVVVNNEAIEVFIDGKLVKTCVAPALPVLNKGELYFSRDGKFDGVLSNMNILPKTLGVAEINQIYMRGPNNNNSLLDLVATPFKVKLNVTFDEQTQSLINKARGQLNTAVSYVDSTVGYVDKNLVDSRQN